MLEFFWKLWLKITNLSCTIKSGKIARKTKLSNNVHIGVGCVIAAKHIGKYTFINNYVLIDANTVKIGAFCSIAYNAKIGLGAHSTNWVSTHAFAYKQKYNFLDKDLDIKEELGQTVIGNDVWIGANAIILNGVKVGNGAIIGANSMVTKDVEPFAVVVGTPAKKIKSRFQSDVCKSLTEIAWWNWDEQKIKENIHLFKTPEKLIQKTES